MLQEFFKDLTTPPPPQLPSPSFAPNEETPVMLIIQHLLFAQEAEREEQKLPDVIFWSQTVECAVINQKPIENISVAKQIFKF